MNVNGGGGGWVVNRAGEANCIKETMKRLSCEKNYNTYKSVTYPLRLTNHSQGIDFYGRTHLIALGNNEWGRRFLDGGKFNVSMPHQPRRRNLRQALLQRHRTLHINLARAIGTRSTAGCVGALLQVLAGLSIGRIRVGC